MPYDIPIYQPSLLGNEKKYVIDCLDTNWISSKGQYVSKFEQKFAEYCGAKYAKSVCNGTVALHLALEALGIGPGDEVIVPTLTYVASVNCITYTGAKPVFVDSTPDTWQTDCDDIIRKITPRTKAILPVHLYGHPCEMTKIQKIAEAHGLFIVEDCAEAFGSRLNGCHVGRFGDLGAFSFFGNKTITTGEGGMIVTDNPTLHHRLTHLNSQGLAHHRQYWHDIVGFNYRLTNICAAIGLAQLEQVSAFISRKRQLAALYKEMLAGLPITFQAEEENAFHSQWMFSLLTANEEGRDALREHLESRRIETRPLFYPVHTMPMHSKRYERHPVAEDIGMRGLNLPSWPGLSDNQISVITSAIHDFYEGAKDRADV
jgi:perosamine synthetase